MQNVACAVCGEDRTTLLYRKWQFNIVQCQNCGLCYVNPRILAIEPDGYFAGPYLEAIEENGALKSGIESIYAGILANLNTYLKPSRLLDVGCAMGHFMVRARQDGWNCQGVECSQYASNYGQHRWDLRIRPVCDLREARLPDNHFDACVMIEVVEHLPHPRITLTEAFHLLKPGGMVYITVPNFSSYRALLEGEDWSAIIPTGHLSYFTPASLERLLKAVGFEHIINLTQAGTFDGELETVQASGKVRLTNERIEEVREKCAREDATKLLNSRGEGLVMCAVKPSTEYSPIRASLRFTAVRPHLDGKLITSSGEGAEDQKVYLISDSRKHWVTSVDWLNRHGMSLDQTIQVDRELVQSFMVGPPLV